MRYVLIVLWILFGSMTSALAQVSVGIGLPGVSIGINLPVYPELVPVPGYPVYYAPGMNSNYFFYDGMYWVYQGDSWYASSWYNGPWELVDPGVVPLFVLRIPVSYYRNPPVYFRGWRSDAPPRWGEHWGNTWAQRRSGWDRWNRGSAPALAPLPVYQRQYSGDRYPRVEQQQTLRSQNYHYQPRDAAVRQRVQAQAVQRAPAPSQRGQQVTPQEKSPGQQGVQRASPPPPVQQSAPAAPRPLTPQRGGENVQRPAPTQVPPQRAGENVQRPAPTQALPQRGGENMQRPAATQALPQRGGENMQRPAPTQAPPQQKGPAVQDQGRQPPPQQGAVTRAQPAPRSSQENNPQRTAAPPEPGRGQAQQNREKGEERGQERK
jgi:hypothetical protein